MHNATSIEHMAATWTPQHGCTNTRQQSSEPVQLVTREDIYTAWKSARTNWQGREEKPQSHNQSQVTEDDRASGQKPERRQTREHSASQCQAAGPSMLPSAHGHTHRICMFRTAVTIQKYVFPFSEKKRTRNQQYESDREYR